MEYLRITYTARMSKYAATIDDIRTAAERITPYAHRTRIATCATLDALASAAGAAQGDAGHTRKLFFKCEHEQKVGAFKFRGACNAVMKLTDDEAANGVVTHSSGNHAQALALAARLRGIDAHIVMPNNASAVKRRAVEGYGARVVLCEPNTAAREGTAERVRAETGATLVHPYDDPNIIAGQGTAALELLQQVEHLDAIVAPVGGGGLIRGTAITCQALAPHVRVFAAEPACADDAARSKATGERQKQEPPDTVADGLLTSLGDHTWPVVRDLVEAVITVEEDAIIEAMRLAWQRAKLLIEPSAAVAVAAVLGDAFKAIDRVGVILSGGNVDIDKLPW